MDAEAQGRLLVLLALEALGGEASKRDALDFLESHGLVALDARAREILATRSEPRWRNNLAYIRQHLKEDGHVASPRRDVWAMTAAGRDALQRMADEARASPDPPIWLSPRALAFLAERAGADAPTADANVLAERVERLRKRAQLPRPGGQSAPQAVTAEVTVFKRDPRVKAWVIEAAGGACELCRNPAPFVSNDGLPYLEVHHVVQLARGGADRVDNAVAICPNCHRELHLGRRAAECRETLYQQVSRLRRP